MDGREVADHRGVEEGKLPEVVRDVDRAGAEEADGSQLAVLDPDGEWRLPHIVLEVRLQLHEEQYNYGCVAVIGAPICCSVVLHCVCFNRLIVFIP